MLEGSNSWYMLGPLQDAAVMEKLQFTYHNILNELYFSFFIHEDVFEVYIDIYDRGQRSKQRRDRRRQPLVVVQAREVEVAARLRHGGREKLRRQRRAAERDAVGQAERRQLRREAAGDGRLRREQRRRAVHVRQLRAVAVDAEAEPRVRVEAADEDGGGLHRVAQDGAAGALSQKR